MSERRRARWEVVAFVLSGTGSGCGLLPRWPAAADFPAPVRGPGSSCWFSYRGSHWARPQPENPPAAQSKQFLHSGRSSPEGLFPPKGPCAGDERPVPVRKYHRQLRPLLSWLLPESALTDQNPNFQEAVGVRPLMRQGFREQTPPRLPDVLWFLLEKEKGAESGNTILSAAGSSTNNVLVGGSDNNTLT